MQKKLIALAVAAVTSGAAFAQTNVTISGSIGATYTNYKISGPIGAGIAISNESRVNDESSQVVFKGEEDLGNGLKAFFQIDSRYNADSGGGAVGSGNDAVGIKGNWGSVWMGNWDMQYDTFKSSGIEGSNASPLAALTGHGLMSQVNGSSLIQTRSTNVIAYDSPNMGGFSGRFAYSTNPANGTEGSGIAPAAGAPDAGSGAAWQLWAKYANGPLNAFFSTYKHSIEGRGGLGGNPNDYTSNRFGVAYTLPMGLKVGLGWDRSSVANGAGAGLETARSAWMLPVTYTMGAHQFSVTYAKANRTSNTAVDNSAKHTVLGYAYTLSKRTAVGAYYTKMDNANPGGALATGGTYDLFGVSAAAQRGTATGAGQDATSMSVGIRHSF